MVILLEKVSMAKNHVADTLHRAVDTALQLNGARGYSKDTPLSGYIDMQGRLDWLMGLLKYKMVLSRIYRNEG